MKQYIKYNIMFFGLIVIIDLVSGILLNNKFNHIKFGDFSDINRSLKSDAEILILGSSRALHHYNPNIISKAFKKKCYNAGFGGHGLFLNYAILKEKIEIHPPKIVILDLSPNIIVDEKSYSKLNSLLPYYNKYNSFKEIIQLNPEFYKLELVSNLYVYNSTLYDFLRSFILKEKKINFGFVPLEGQINENKFSPFILENEKMDNNKITYLNKIINLCETENIRLISVISPTYLKFDHNNLIIDKLKSIILKKNLEFYDYSNYAKLYLKNRYFKDQLHMNGIGSDIFSKELVQKLNY